MSADKAPDLFEGDLEAVALERVLDRLGSEGVTGILTVQSEEDIIAISFEAGLIVGADALNETLEDGLGKALVSEGLLTEAQFSSVLGRVRAEHSRLSEVLLDEGVLAIPDYLAAVRRYSISLVSRCSAWDRGDYKFYAGEEVSYEEGFESISVTEVALLEEAAGEPAPAEVDAPEDEVVEAALPIEPAEPTLEPLEVDDLAPVYPYEEAAPRRDLLDAIGSKIPASLKEPAAWSTWVGPTIVSTLR